MCHDGNSASQSVRYLNAQLVSLYENASGCVEACGTLLNFKSVEYDKTKYSRSLAQYHFIGPKPKHITSTKELFFSANFATPKLTFICNHEAILYLTVKDGHYNPEFSKASIAGSHLEQSKNKNISDLTFAFRIKFTRTGLKGSNSKIGNGSSHLIQLMILDFENARLVSINPALSHSQQEAMTFYMRSYLEFLERAGHHVLFDLPDFDDDKYSPTIDYSVSTTLEDVEQFCSNEVVHGIDLGDINSFLHKKWLSLARLGHPADALSICLAEISSAWLLNASIDTKFHIQFGPPKVRALCKNEVILTFDLEKIAFFNGESFDSEEPEEYSDWKISFIVEVSEEKEADGAIKMLKLNLSTARFSHHFSRVSDTTEITLAFFYQIVQFLSVDYLDILVQYAMHMVYHIDTRVVVGHIDFGHGHHSHHGSKRSKHSKHSKHEHHEHHQEHHEHHEHHEHEHDHDHHEHDHDQGHDESSTDSGDEWTPLPDQKVHRKHAHLMHLKDCVQKTVMYGYDQILSISEESINHLFWTMWTRGSRSDSEILSKWKHELFNAAFGAMKVRLLSNGKAIIWVHVNEGQLHIKSECERTHWWNLLPWSPAKSTDKTEAHSFTDLSLAFEVDLKMVEQKAMDLHDSWFHRFKTSQIYHCHQDAPQRMFMHLFLDLAHAVYQPDLSNIDCLVQGKGRMVVDKLETAIRYITTYLGHLAHHGHHIIHSVPLFDAHSKSAFGLTSVVHHVVTKHQITLSNCAHARKSAESPVILIMGMCGGRTLTFNPPHWGSGWVIAGKTTRSLGTICLSKEAFLEGTLLHHLADINAMTTIVPNFAGIIDGEWSFDLTTWAQHPFRKNKVCRWKQDKIQDGCLKYIWEHRQGWTHQHEGSDGNEQSGEYTIECRTRNNLHIPTGYHPGSLEIVLSGESTLNASGKGIHHWSKTSKASWQASICISSRSNGLHIEVKGSTKPTFSDVHAEGDYAIDFESLHAQHMPELINLDRVIDELKSTLQGTWEYSAPGHFSYSLSNPAFTPTGDLVVQLASYEAMMKKEITSPSTPVRKPQMYIKAPSVIAVKDGSLHTSSTPGDSPSILTPLLEFVSHAQPSVLIKSMTSNLKTETSHHMETSHHVETNHHVEISEAGEEIVY